MSRFKQIGHSAPAEWRGLSNPAFVVRFSMVLEHRIPNDQGSFLTTARSSRCFSSLPKMQHYFVKPSNFRRSRWGRRPIQRMSKQKREAHQQACLSPWLMSLLHSGHPGPQKRKKHERGDAMDSPEQRTMTKVSRRLIPFLILCYFVAYLDRTNVGFAALTMRQDLNISATAYGLGAGIFFLSYFVFEVPSNLALERFGARKWIARIMITWGILSGCMAFIGGEWSFYVVRLLLGAAEAGFFPGIIFYLTLWFPSVYRARIVGMFMAAIPGSTVFGAPLSSALLYLDGVAGLKGWQWMFILEAIPAIILALVVLKFLTDRPSEAHWLRPEEREWLSGRIEAEARQRVAARHFSVGQALTNGRVLALAFVYFGAVATNYGISFWLPQIVQDFGGLSKFQVG